MEQNYTTVKELPDSEKPYEKFLESGVETLSDAELLAVIIRSGTHGRRSVGVAQDFLGRKDKSLLNLYALSYGDMLKIPGIGPVKAIQLKCVAELSKRIAQTNYQNRLSLSNPRSIAEYYMERLRHEKQEQTMALLFDAKCRLLDDVTLTVGSATAAFVSPREIFLAALSCGAVQLVLVHNHPSGDATPSAEDDIATKRVAECGNILGIPLVDHIIVGDRTYYSYRECKRIIYKGENNDE